MEQFQIDEITSRASLAVIEQEWRVLLESSRIPTVFLTWEWVSSYFEHYGERCRPWILLVRSLENGALLAIAPFSLGVVDRIRPFQIRELSFIGSGYLSPDHLDLIVRPGWEDRLAGIVGQYIWRKKKLWDVIWLRSCSAGAPLCGVLNRQQRRAFSHVHKVICPYIALPDTWSELEARFGKNLRRNIRRESNRFFKEYGDRVTFRKICDISELGHAMQQLFELHQQSKIAKGKAGAFGDSLFREFHLDFAKKLLEVNQLCFYLLEIDGRAVTALYGFSRKGTTAFYQAGYDVSLQSYSPMRQLLVYGIQQAIVAGDHEVDLLRGDDEYKFRLAKKSRTDQDHLIPVTIRGFLFVLLYRMARYCRSVLAKE